VRVTKTLILAVHSLTGLTPTAFRELGARWALELFLLFSLLLLVGFALPGVARLSSLSPHPFWIPVLLLSVQYGTSGGITAALCAIVLAWLIGWPTQGGGEDFYDYSLRIWREPILWLAAALILGGFRSQHLYKLDALHAQLANADIQRQSIANLFNTLKSHCEDLERRVACAQDRSIEAGLAVLNDLRESSLENAQEALGVAVDLLLGPTVYTVLLRRDGRFIEHPEFGMGAGKCALSPELECCLLQSTHVWSILREEEALLLAGSGLFAAPILSSANQRVLGVLLIQKMDAVRIQEDVEISLQAICRELTDVLSKDKDQVVVNFERDRLASRGNLSSENSSAARVAK
jgi:hypothetical protein